MTHLGILTLRNEAAFLLEWLAHHRAAGLDHVLVFTNDCEDGTVEMLERLEVLGWITHQANPGPYDKGGIQFTALKRAAKLDVVQEADWILPLDIDEFVNIHVGDGTFAALHDALPKATAITLTWRLFGNAGVLRYADVPVSDTFTRCAPEVLIWPWRAAMFKTLYRNDGTYRKPGVHRPRAPDRSKLEDARWYDGHGRTLGAPFLTQRIFSDFGRPNYGLVQLNHYPLGAMESFILKADRGRAVHTTDRLGMDYWTERNFCTQTDTSIARYRTARNAHLSTLMADAELCELHKQAVAWRKARFETLMEEEANRALFGRLMMTPPTQPLAPDRATELFRYTQHKPTAS